MGSSSTLQFEAAARPPKVFFFPLRDMSKQSEPQSRQKYIQHKRLGPKPTSPSCTACAALLHNSTFLVLCALRIGI